jgi:hypothetical protein
MIQNRDLLNELLGMRELDIHVSDNTLNHARIDDLSQYEGISVGDLASLFCELYNLPYPVEKTNADVRD